MSKLPIPKTFRSYKKLKNNLLMCKICHQYCILGNNQKGKCGIHKNQNGKNINLTYGYHLGLHIDPIEKKPLYHFLPGTPILSFGTPGCNFRCDFCQNWTMSQVQDNPSVFNMRQKMTPQEIVHICKNQNIPSIAYTYNEPTVFFEYAYAVMHYAHDQGIKNVWVSNGYFSPYVAKHIQGLLDAINIDLKSFSDNFYQKHCNARLQPVLDMITRVHKHNIHLELTTLLITGENDSDQELTALAKRIAKLSPTIPWHVSAFYPTYKCTHLPPTPRTSLEKAYNIGKQAGLLYVYIGNIDTPYRHTYCPTCTSKVITRQYYHITSFLQDGSCPKCGTKIHGIRQ